MLTLLLALLPSPALARDLHGRLGVGFEDQLSGNGGISARYWLPGGKDTPQIGVEAVLGLDLRDGGEGVSAGVRGMWAFLEEDNLNLYAAGGLGWVGAAESVRMQPSMGAEFFLFGLENLGFSAEWGLNVDLGRDVAVATPGRAVTGVRYYF